METCGIPEYFDGAVVFITGGTGFLGKVLVEKLLRSCLGIERIVLLMRPKRGLQLQERLDKMYSLPLFDRLKKERPGFFEKKIKAVQGDVRELGLGLSDEDRAYLVENVNFVYHSAASVRFDQPLRDAILLNTRGARELCKLVLELKYVKVVLHVSTAYCHTDKKVIEEKMYPPHADWRKTIALAEGIDRHSLEIVAPLYMSGFPNTYTFTKSLAESAFYDLLDGKVTNIIIRPTIVISSLIEPMPGWNDNYNGPVGIMIAAGSGLIRNSYVHNIRSDYMCVDTAIKGIIMATWVNGTKGDPDKRTKVYNASSHGFQNMKVSEMVDLAIDLAWDVPLEKCVWYPSTRTTSSMTVYYIYVMLFHFLPGLFLDGILKILRFKPSVLRLHRKIYNATMALRYFMENEWVFENAATYGLEFQILPEDREAFAYNVGNLYIPKYFMNIMIGAKQYLLKESMDNIKGVRTKFRLFYYLDCLTSILIYITLFYLLWYKFNIFSLTYNWGTRYVTNL